MKMRPSPGNFLATIRTKQQVRNIYTTSRRTRTCRFLMGNGQSQRRATTHPALRVEATSPAWEAEQFIIKPPSALHLADAAGAARRPAAA
jgi:hypothetical protein